MLQVYSDGIDVAANTAIPLNNVSLVKGNTALPSGIATVNLNKCGVYCVKMDAFGQAGAVGDITIQMTKNGVLQADAISTVTGATGDTDALSFETLVQVGSNNSSCPCSEPTKLQFMLGDVNVTGLHINVTVTKLV